MEWLDTAVQAWEFPGTELAIGLAKGGLVDMAVYAAGYIYQGDPLWDEDMKAAIAAARDSGHYETAAALTRLLDNNSHRSPPSDAT